MGTRIGGIPKWGVVDLLLVPTGPPRPLLLKIDKNIKPTIVFCYHYIVKFEGQEESSWRVLDVDECSCYLRSLMKLRLYFNIYMDETLGSQDFPRHSCRYYRIIWNVVPSCTLSRTANNYKKLDITTK